MKTNLIYALRNLTKNMTNSVISIVGMAIALACCLWIYLMFSQENTYNNFHKNQDRLYRLNYKLRYIDFTANDVRIDPEIADKISKQVPQVEKATEYRFAFSQTLKFSQTYYDVDVAYADKEFFDMFTFPLLAGDKSKIFTGRDEIVITREFADKLIPGKKKDYSSILGKSVDFPIAYPDRTFLISGILEKIPRNSTIQFEGIIPGNENGRNFGGCDNYIGYTSVFYLLKTNANPKDAGNNVNKLLKEHYEYRINNLRNANMVINTDQAFAPYVLPMKSCYLEHEIGNCFEKTSNKKYGMILIGIGVLILLIASSNYTMLSLGQSLKKIGDVGVRKVMGASSRHVFSIFFTEGAILTIGAILLGGFLCILLLDRLEGMENLEIFTENIQIPQLILFVGLIFFLIVLLTSIIPVFVFSRISPNQMAGNTLRIGKKGVSSQLFVSFQYALSIILIIVTVSILRQSNYMRNQSLGLSSENIIDINIMRLDYDQKILLADMLKEHPGVESLTLTSRNFMNGSSDSYIDKGDGQQIDVYRFKVDDNYIPTLKLNLTYGRNFSRGNCRPGDNAMIVNNRFIEAFEIQDDPIGRTYNMFGTNYTIIGVVDDYHFQNFRRKLRPAMLFAATNYGNNYNNILLRYHADQLISVMDHIKKTHREVAGEKKLAYSFWDEELGKRYVEEAIWSKIIGFASTIAILISSLGLFGLTLLIINQRIKEIGIRKVNGARSSEILLILNKAFAKWLAVSFFIATPVSLFIVRRWLENYAYRAPVGWWVFMLSGTTALFIALITVSWQTWSAARKNPVEALRYE